jgi:hypothetical protein
MALEITHAVPMAGALWLRDCSNAGLAVDALTTSIVEAVALPLAIDRTKSEFAAAMTAVVLSGIFWLAYMK